MRALVPLVVAMLGCTSAGDAYWTIGDEPDGFFEMIKTYY